MTDNILQETLYNSVKQIIEKGRSTVFKAVNYTMIISNWEIGCEIVEIEQEGQDKAQYGKYIVFERKQQI